MRKVFLDTNIVVDLLEKREEFYRDAINIFQLGLNGILKLYVSPITFATASYLLRKQPNVNELLNNLRLLVDISTMDRVVVDDALASCFLDKEDALQYFSAIKEGVSCIVTRNEKDFNASEIPVFTPQDFLDTI